MSTSSGCSPRRWSWPALLPTDDAGCTTQAFQWAVARSCSALYMTSRPATLPRSSPLFALASSAPSPLRLPLGLFCSGKSKQTRRRGEQRRKRKKKSLCFLPTAYTVDIRTGEWRRNEEPGFGFNLTLEAILLVCPAESP
jgi:hypothetical protein